VIDFALRIIRAAEASAELKEKVRGIREDSLAHLFEYLDAFVESAEAQGVVIHHARTAADALRIIRELADDAVMSKTTVGKEIGLNAFKTDTGDFIHALVGGSGHPILPALGAPPDKIASALRKEFGIDVEPNPHAIVRAIAQIVRRKILSAGAGITGANVFSSDGAVFILENEANVALVSHIPRVHIVVTGIEKVVKDAESAVTVCKALSVFGTAQRFPTYINVVAGPSSTADVGGTLVRPAQGPEEVHVILLDNGRKKLYDSKYRDVLKCINCGACVSVCPVFHAVAEKFGFERKGIVGILLQRYQKTEEELSKVAYMCTGCALCDAVCPVGIPLSRLLLTIRSELHKRGFQTEKNRAMIERILGGEAREKVADTDLYCC